MNETFLAWVGRRGARSAGGAARAARRGSRVVIAAAVGVLASGCRETFLDCPSGRTLRGTECWLSSDGAVADVPGGPDVPVPPPCMINGTDPPGDGMDQ